MKKIYTNRVLYVKRITAFKDNVYNIEEEILMKGGEDDD